MAVNGRLNEQQSETDRDSKLFVLLATKVSCEKIPLQSEIINPSKKTLSELDQDELEEYDEMNKQQLRSASKPLSYSKKNFGKLMQRQARAAIEEEKANHIMVPDREIKKKEKLD